MPSTTLSLPIISRKEVSMHDDYSSAWIILHNLVYDITQLIADDAHPGSTEILLEYLGTDASSVFESCGHSRHARRLVQKYVIGQLPDGEAAGVVPEHIAYSKLVNTTTPLVA